MNTLTQAEIAKRLKLAPSTLQYWIRTYGDYLKPVQPKTGRYKLYGEEDLEILQTIKTNAEQGLQAPQIRTILADQFGEVVEADQQRNEDTTTTNLQQPPISSRGLATTNVQQMSSMLDWQRNQNALTESYRRQNAELIQRIEELEREVSEKNAQLAEVRQNAGQQKGGILAWLRP